MAFLRDSNPWAPHANARRAMNLLLGGALGAHCIAAPAIVVALLWRGTPGLVGGLLGLAAVVLCFGVGQAVQIALVDADPQIVLVSSLASYATRIGLLGAALFFLRPRADLLGLDRISLFCVVIAVTLGWLAGEIFVFRRMRIPVYDTEYLGPGEQEGGKLL